MKVTIRKQNNETDLEGIVKVYNKRMVEPITVEQMKRWLEQRPAEMIVEENVAVTETGQVIGYNDMRQRPWLQLGRFNMEVVIDPDYTQHGAGTLLYNRALAFGQENGAKTIETMVRDDKTNSLSFAQKQGFTIKRFHFSSILDITTLSDEYFDKKKIEGLEIKTAAELGNTEKTQQLIHELNRRAAQDVPGEEGPFMDYPYYCSIVFNSTWYRPEGFFIAFWQGQPVGLSCLRYTLETKSTYNLITGVDREHRGKGIATALKLQTIKCAREWGAHSILTNNDSENEPMLAINRKLGYTPQPTDYVMIKVLTSL